MTSSRGTDIINSKRAYSTRNEGNFPETFDIVLTKESNKKYGENPHQQCAVYAINFVNGHNTRMLSELTNLRSVRTDAHGKGGLSLTNEMDVTRGMDTLKYFDVPAVVIMKHNIVSGFARRAQESQKQVDVFRLARDTDRQSNFGGTAVFNKPIDRETAEALYELKGESPFFVDVLAAPGFNQEVLDYIQSQSKNIRIAEFSGLANLPKFVGDHTYGLMSFKEMPTGRMGVQDLYLTSIRRAENLVLDPMVTDLHGTHVIKRDPTQQELDDLLTAWWLNVSGARSNGIVAVRNGITTAVGSGQVERFGAGANAIVKGIQKAMDREGLSYDPLMGIQGFERLRDNPFKGAVVSSDAFFPFPDSIEIFARVGVSAIVQPYGSIRDGQVIDAANSHGIAMPATLERCFGHF